MKSLVYIETTIVSYLTARPARTVIAAGRQQVTIDWWEQRRHCYELVASDIVLREASAGDEQAAARRLAILQGIPLLAMTDAIANLALGLVNEGIIPTKAADDAAHIALCAMYQINYLLTWNCAHIANAEIQDRLAEFFLTHQLRLPVICTPDELFGENENE
jgi:hypothetical protein